VTRAGLNSGLWLCAKQKTKVLLASLLTLLGKLYESLGAGGEPSTRFFAYCVPPQQGRVTAQAIITHSFTPKRSCRADSNTAAVIVLEGGRRKEEEATLGTHTPLGRVTGYSATEEEHK